ncbi:MAG: glucose-1-phosphate adenylyltransferase [Erysipelotrichaceae bacterium]|nr:glucose-1-phosphate adenylyltransferase [Erysipelotrichaceae bacterium]
MKSKKLIAMILAGGRGSRLFDLTKRIAKPAVHYGGRYRIIDFPLSNCANSNIATVGVLVQYESVLLNSYVARDYHWGLDMKGGGVFVLPPREKDELGIGAYKGTADAIAQNIDFLDQEDADYILVLSGDHIYKMNYELMLDHHIKQNADATIAILEVPKKEASRFGIMNVDADDNIVDFEEKPSKPKSNLASMGIYIFSYKKLRKYLKDDEKNPTSNHDFGKDIIPAYLNNGEKLTAYRFKGYWKDVGTVDSLWEANMDLLKVDDTLNLFDSNWKIYTEENASIPQIIGETANIKNSYITQGCVVDGDVNNSVLFTDSIVHSEAKVYDSILMNGAIIDSLAVVKRCIVAENVHIPKGLSFINEDHNICLITQKLVNEKVGELK